MTSINVCQALEAAVNDARAEIEADSKTRRTTSGGRTVRGSIPGEVDVIFDHPMEALLDPHLSASEPLVELNSEHWPSDAEFYVRPIICIPEGIALICSHAYIELYR